MSTTAYGSRSIKRVRRTRGAIDIIKSGIIEVLEEIQPATVRQVYYQCVSRGLIPKTEGAYKMLVRLLTEMRRDRLIPFDYLADSTRWMRKPRTYRGAKHALRETARFYRRSLWADSPTYCEVWLEKDALAGVLFEVTEEFDVPLMVTRGYPSLTFLHSAAEAIAKRGVPAHLYYFGDRDPSGLNIPQVVERGIREFAPKVELHFERVAVTDQQIVQYNLPTRPTKKTDTRSNGFDGRSVEVDAIPPAELRRLAHECITQHIDPRVLEQTLIAEASEREWLTQLAELGVGE
jgi:hypothetical protein